jgi:putative peptide zinc metalloprotease protein
MSNATISASTDQRLDLRGRPDLISKPIEFRGTRYWSVKDPLSLRYYQLCDEELFLLEQADGRRSFAELKHLFEDRFSPRKIDSSELHAFLGTLHREGLLTSQSAGQGGPLLERHERIQRQERLQAITNLLAIRFRGLDPEPMLRWLYPKVRWLFSTPAIFIGLLAILGAVLSLGVYAEAFVSRLPRLETFLSVENVIVLAAVLAVCKVLHELGHALTCKHFGGECHELGVMFLVFTPCLYCNVSDAWMLRSKWQRIAISGAGIYVELLLASVCTFMWWFSQPGLLNAIFLNVMVVCSVSSILFNGNPLLRYDGYFVLADFVELPNLRQQSQAYLWQLMMRLMGIDPREAWTLQEQHRVTLASYGIASLIYRWILVIGILLVLYRASQPYRLESIVQLFALFVLGSMLFSPLRQTIRTFREPRIARRGRSRRMLLVALAMLGSGVLIGMIPVSRHVRAPVVLEPANASRMHVVVPGTLTRFANIGQHVDKGDVIAQLENAELERDVVSLRGERNVRQLHVEQLQKLQVLERSSTAEGAGSQIVTAKEALAAANRQLEQRQRDYTRLTLTAPQAGIVMPDRPRRINTSSEQLPTWSGTPFDNENLGSHLETETVVCLLGDPKKLVAIAMIEQSQLKRIRIGQSVRIMVDELHNRVLTGSVKEIARSEAEQLPPELIAKQLLPPTTTTSPSRYYAVSIELSAGPNPLLWSSGKAKIVVTPISLAEAVYEQLCNTFRIDL